MDRKDLTDRLPAGWFSLDRVPGIGGESEPPASEPPDTFDEPIADSDTPEEADSDTPEEADSDTPEEADEESQTEDQEGPSRREQTRKALLGVSLGGATLAVVAALVRRLLGEDTEDEPIVEVELDVEQTEPAPDAEAVAATIGLAFQVLVRRLVGEDEPET